MHMVTIVVPVYKKALENQELISYRQLLKVLGTFEIIVVAPEGLQLPKEIRGDKLRIEYFPKDFFKSVDTYSRLMLSTDFYKRFIKYQFILIYQLDAFVFKDELAYFCGLDCDYIGAPWISGFCEYTNLKRKVLYVGNGGFSLRRVEACIDALQCNGKLLDQYRGRNEDVFFSACDGRNFRTASVETALAFSFEREVRTCFEVNHRLLPFGCHAWERYDLKFWKKYIMEFGYEIDETEAVNGKEDQSNKEEYVWMRRNTKLMENDDLFYGILEKIECLFNDTKKGCYYLWGAGYIGRYAKDLFWDLGMRLEGFIDTDPTKQGKDIDGLMIYNPECIKEDKKIIVTVDRKYYSGIIEKLKSLNLSYLRNYIFFEDILPEV